MGEWCCMQFTQQTLENVTADLLIVGVSEHQTNLSEWNTFTEVFGEQTNMWLKSDDIAVGLKKENKTTDNTYTCTTYFICWSRES